MIEVGGEINPYEVAGQCLNKDTDNPEDGIYKWE